MLSCCLLGAIAVLISGGLGYVSARDALEQSIYNQLIAARETKTHQVENYFRSISSEIQLLANTAMVVEAMHSFRDAVDELDRTEVPGDVRTRVEGWYADQFMPTIRRQLGQGAPVEVLPADGFRSVFPPGPLHRRQSKPDRAEACTG